MPSVIEYRNRAERCLEMAAQAADDTAAKQLRVLAANYLELAETFERSELAVRQRHKIPARHPPDD
jgi:hypothetical protein